MNDTSFPTEIYANIIEEFISVHADPSPKEPEELKFIPRVYLTPLLRVSKQWYANSVKYLYQSIAVGRSGRLRGRESAEALHKTLKENSELAALVERLQLGIESHEFINYREEWAQTNTGLLQLCPNVVHVEIRGFKRDEFDDLVRVLEEKSLISFSMSSWCLLPRVTSPGERLQRLSCPGGRTSKLLGLMQNWPKVRSVQLEGFEEDADCIPLDITQTCPDLREIAITRTVLRPLSYTALRTMCSGGVTKLSVRVNPQATHALCECLRTWSTTLTYLRIQAFAMWNCPELLLSLMEAIATLIELRALEFNGGGLVYDVISKLPRLERIYCLPNSWAHEECVQQLSTLLEDSDKLPSLTYIGGNATFIHLSSINPQFQNICQRRDIRVGLYYTRFYSSDTRQF